MGSTNQNDKNTTEYLINHFKKSKNERTEGTTIKQQFNIKHSKKIFNQILEKSDRIKTIFKAMSDLGCPVNANKHISIEYCPENCKGIGFFFQPTNQVIVCQEKFDKLYFESSKVNNLEHIMSHELIHAFDHCRARMDINTPEHLMCSEIRASALSGECVLKFHPFQAVFSLVKSYHKKCVLNHALISFQYYFKDWNDKDAKNLAEKLFSTCYNDHEPFDRLPLNKKDSNFSYKAYLTRNRYKI